MRRYESRDLEMVNGWRRVRGAGPLPFDPRTAFIVPEVAFGALVLTDVGSAFIDGYSTNPEASAATRAAALEDITIELVGEAGRREVKRLYVLTSEPSIAARAEQGGGKYLGMQMVFGLAL